MTGSGLYRRRVVAMGRMKNELRMKPKKALPIALWLVKARNVRVARSRVKLKTSLSHAGPTGLRPEDKAPNRFAAWMHAPAIP